MVTFRRNAEIRGNRSRDLRGRRRAICQVHFDLQACERSCCTKTVDDVRRELCPRYQYKRLRFRRSATVLELWKVVLDSMRRVYVSSAARQPAAAEPILRNALASAYAPPFRIPAWQVGEAESALGWCLHALGDTREAQRLLQLSQNKLLSDPRPIYRKRATTRFFKNAGNAHAALDHFPY
jgi:hypothetical protein